MKIQALRVLDCIWPMIRSLMNHSQALRVWYCFQLMRSVMNHSKAQSLRSLPANEKERVCLQPEASLSPPLCSLGLRERGRPKIKVSQIKVDVPNPTCMYIVERGRNSSLCVVYKLAVIHVSFVYTNKSTIAQLARNRNSVVMEWLGKEHMLQVWHT